MSAPGAPTRSARAVTVVAVTVVGAVAAVVSYDHMREVAAEAGEEWRAYLLPLSVDGLMVAAGLALLTRRRAGLPGGALAWAALLGGAAASLAANVVAAEDTTTARLVAAWAPVALEAVCRYRAARSGLPLPHPRSSAALASRNWSTTAINSSRDSSSNPDTAQDHH